MATKVARGKALVAKLRADPQVRDAEALAAYLGRVKRLKKGGLSTKAAIKAAGGAAKSTAGAKKASATLSALSRREKEIANQRIESAHVFDEKGNEVFSKRGDASSVGFTLPELKQVRGRVFTHNHPSALDYADDDDPRSMGNSFSKDDVMFAVMQEVAEMRAVTPKRRFILKPTAAGFNTPWARSVNLPQVIAEEEAALRREFEGKIATGDLDYRVAEATHYDELWRRVAKKTGMTYTATDI